MGLDDPEGERALPQLPAVEATLPLAEPAPAGIRPATPAPPVAEPRHYRITRRPMDRLNEFLEDLALDQEREEDAEAGDAVTLITMHAAKGLEFPHVHIVGVEDGLLPHSRSKVEGTLDEERRLFYVAITRAQETLKVSHCSGRKRYGQLMPCHPSPFLKELPGECVEDGAMAGTAPVASTAGGDWFAAMRAAIE